MSDKAVTSPKAEQEPSSSRDSCSPKAAEQEPSSSIDSASPPRTPLTAYQTEVMDPKPVPSTLLAEIARSVDGAPENPTWRDLKQWFFEKRPSGPWTMQRLYAAQAQAHADYLDEALRNWAKQQSAKESGIS